MKSALIFSLFQSVKQISGVGEKRFEAYKRLNIFSLRDLIYHFPVDKIDRRNEPALSSTTDGQVITQVVKVDQINLPPARVKKIPARITCSNDSGAITLVYFNMPKDFIKSKFSLGKKIAISGKVNKNYGQLDMVHPDIVTEAANLNSIKQVEPVYPLTYSLTSRYLGLSIVNCLRNIPALPEWLDASLIAKRNWPSWKEAIEIVHYRHQDKLALYSQAKERLAYDEILAQQVCLQIARGKIKVLRKQPLNFSGELQQKFLKTLPFELTRGQKEVIAEISQDQKATNRMFRLLQGDVGSGKTVVAFCAMLNMVEGKKQAALMVPTEILARQHYHKLLKMGEALDIKVGILINAMKSSEKESTKNLLERGEIDVVVGTHALFQEHVKFKDLGLVVIDEQHRFGVEQRLTLIDKGKEADYLMMTATPIPRTLEMAAYGDIDISTIREKPHGRQEIVTSIVRASKIDEVLSGLKRMLVQGNKIYWVCPLIDDSEKLSLANVKERFDFLNIAFPGQVGLIHGQMSANGREESMAKFLQGEFKILVATTVIEVGVDVPDATVIIIENAERFGLSQLHQLRGRVGRSDKKSYCILLAGHALGDIGYARLSALKDSNDGFELAEKDLNFRGRGDLLGTKQSGLPNFRAYDFFQHNKLIPTARAQAQEILAQDPKLTSERGEKIKMLLHLFEMDKSLSYIETCR